MPAKSKKQWKFMKMIEKGAIVKPSLTPDKAKEYTETNYKKLPEKK